MGILRRIVVIEKEDGTILELVNPEIIATAGEQEGLEGCLSLPGVWGVVKRPMTVTVKAMDRNGNVYTDTESELIGRCFVHECEHLDGILFVDRASKILRKRSFSRWRKRENRSRAARRKKLENRLYGHTRDRKDLPPAALRGWS